MDQVMRTLLATLALLALASAKSQSWCPPGATWTHEYADVMGGQFGVQRLEYVGDTLLGGFMAQRLMETHVTAPWGSTQFTSSSYSSLYTRSADRVVYLWNGVNEYDTLFWFGAVPGDHWYAPGFVDEEFARLSVVDTATLVLQGIPLRQVMVENMNGWPMDTLTERIGFAFLNLRGYEWFLLDMPWNGLLCYRDDELSFNAPGELDCGFTLSMHDGANPSGLATFPNPGTTHFTLELPHGPHTITLFDATGRMVLEQRTTEERPVISTEHLPSGLYRIVVRDEQGAVMGATWVKER